MSRPFFWLLPLLLLLAVAALWAGEAGFVFIKAVQGELAGRAASAPVATRLGFLLVFIVATAFSIPVATLLALLAGAVFGFWEGIGLVALASSTGATLAMLGARHFFRAPVEARWPIQVAAINSGFARDGDAYLFALRLAPTPPYFVVNLLMGLTRMPAWRFFIVSLFGMLPLDAVFVNAGRTLARLDSPADLLDGQTIMAFALAGLLPLFWRWGWRRMKLAKGGASAN